MSKFFNLNDDERKIVISQIGARTNNLFPQIVEKDLWVTSILQLVFSLPFADKLVFKGGTSLSKIWNVVERFSEDIDLAIDRTLFGFDGDLTVKQLSKLRKQSSLFVKETFCLELQKTFETHGLQRFLTIEPQPDGEGNKTYPEPRKIFIRYQSLFDPLSYISSEIVLEIGARALIEPTATRNVKSIISENSDIDTSFVNTEIITAVPEKTFIEKSFLLHEIFTGNGNMLANRKSRHLYDLEKMMDKEFAIKAVSDDMLWNTIRHHRDKFTHINGIDYSQDIRKNICLIPPTQIIDNWKQDYETMQNTMIYGESLSFDKLVERLEELQERFRKLKS